MNAPRHLKAACIQMNVIDCDKEANISKAISMAKKAVSEGAEILIFPEVFSTGFCYGCMDSLSESLTGETINRMCAFSEEYGCILIFSIIEKKTSGNEDAYYNLGVCIENGRIAGTYRKTHPFKKEKQYFSAGDNITPIKLGTTGLVIGLEICYELRFPEVARKLVLEGCDILVTIAAFPAPRRYIWRSLSIARSIENQIPHIACNRVGDSRDSAYFGGSIIVDSMGVIEEEAGNEEKIIFSSLELDDTLKTRHAISVFDDRRPEIY